MSTVSYLASLVQQAIGRMNAYESNAKKVDELPHQTTLEPTSKIPVSRAGISEHVTVQQIISSIQNSNYNQLLAIGTISVSGTDITVPSGVSGQINGLLYGTSTDTILSITLCPTGFSRKDIIVLTTANTVVVISGEETDGAIVLAPPVPTDAVYITEFDVNDTTIGAPIDPSVGTQFKKKDESRKFSIALTGADQEIELRAAGHSAYSVTGTGLTSIAGFSTALITASPSADPLYTGKDILFYNDTDAPVILKNAFGGVDVAFNFGADLVVPIGGKVWMKYYTTGLELVMKSWSDVVSEKISITHSPNTLISMTTLGTWAFFDYRGFAGATLSYTLGTGTNPSITADLSTAMSIIPPIGKKLKGFYIWTNSGVGFEIGILKSDVLTPSTLTTNDTNTNRRFIQKFALGNNQRQPTYHEITSDDADASAGSQYFPCVINTSGSTQSLRFCAIYIIE